MKVSSIQTGRRSVIVGIVVVSFAASACSSPRPREVASISRTPATLPSLQQSDQDFVDFTRCLRSHGVNEPDPFHRPGHSGLSIELPAPGSTTSGALAACNHFIASIVQTKEAGARRELTEWLPALTRYAACMRAHDIAMLDPSSVPSPGGLVTLGTVPGIINDFGRYSPQFHAADSACRHLLPAAVHDHGTGP
jgi:hypothetical protein